MIETTKSGGWSFGFVPTGTQHIQASKAVRTHLRASPKRRARRAAGAVVVIVIFTIAGFGIMTLAMAVLGLAIIGGWLGSRAGSAIQSWWESRGLREGNPFVASDWRYTVDDSGFTACYPDSEVRILWSAFREIVVTDDFLLLFLDGMLVYYVPTAVLGAEEQNVTAYLLHQMEQSDGIPPDEVV